VRELRPKLLNVVAAPARHVNKQHIIFAGLQTTGLTTTGSSRRRRSKRRQLRLYRIELKPFGHQIALSSRGHVQIKVAFVLWILFEDLPERFAVVGILPGGLLAGLVVELLDAGAGAHVFDYADADGGVQIEAERMGVLC